MCPRSLALLLSGSGSDHSRRTKSMSVLLLLLLSVSIQQHSTALRHPIPSHSATFLEHSTFGPVPGFLWTSVYLLAVLLYSTQRWPSFVQITRRSGCHVISCHVMSCLRYKEYGHESTVLLSLPFLLLCPSPSPSFPCQLRLLLTTRCCRIRQ